MQDNLETQFQHYVSQFYLNGWQTTVDSKPKRVWTYEKNKNPRHKSIKRTAGEDNFYGIKNFSETLDISTVENFLGEIETRAGRVISKIIQKKLINNIERKYLADFLIVFSLRSPARKNKTEKYLLTNLPNIINVLEDKACTISVEKQTKAFDNISKTKEWFQKNPDCLFPTTIPQNSVINNLSNELLKMDWGFFYTNNFEFLTCDNPFILSNWCGIKNYEYGPVIFPINRFISLQIMNSTQFNNNYFEINNNQVDEINGRIIGNAYTQVYASYKSEKIKYRVQNMLGKDL